MQTMRSSMKISDEIREWCDEADPEGEMFWKIRYLADRIDAEYVELPVDKDGVHIKVGDTVHREKWGEKRVRWIEFHGDYWMVALSSGLGRVLYGKPGELTHERPDSLERIADEIEEADVDGCIDWAARIRKLAKEGE